MNRQRTTRFAPISLLFLLILVGAAAPGCDHHPCDPKVDPLVGHWIVSDEPTGESGEWIYRPYGAQDLPLSRFRSEFIFNEDGTCRFLVLAPNDAHYWADGTWRRDDADRSVVHVSSSVRNFSFRILELDSTVLRIREL